jgi:hypothetical protein
VEHISNNTTVIVLLVRNNVIPAEKLIL